LSRRSGTRHSEPPEPFVFFVDRSLGRRTVVEALREAGAHVEAHDDHFAPDTADEDWLIEVGGRGWIVLTKDQRIRRRPHELQALKVAKVRAFVLTSQHLRGEEMAAIFVKHLRRIERLARREAPPFIAQVTQARVALIG
jgi:hypothetical protein